MIEIRFIKDFKHNLGSNNTRLYYDLKTIKGAINRVEKDKFKPKFDYIEIYQYPECYKFNEDFIKKSLKKVISKNYFN